MLLLWGIRVRESRRDVQDKSKGEFVLLAIVLVVVAGRLKKLEAGSMSYCRLGVCVYLYVCVGVQAVAATVSLF